MLKDCTASFHVFEAQSLTCKCRQAALEAELPTQRLERALTAVVNGQSAENGSNTPDFILARYLLRCLLAFDEGVRRREEWYGRDPNRGPAGMTAAEVDLALKEPS